MSGWLNGCITGKGEREGFSPERKAMEKPHSYGKSVLSRIVDSAGRAPSRVPTQEGVIMHGDVEWDKTGGERKAGCLFLRVWPVRGGRIWWFVDGGREQWLLHCGRILRTSVGQGHREAKL